MSEVKGFKVFNPDWTCRGFRYEVGQTYEENVIPRACDRGLHLCRWASYKEQSRNRSITKIIVFNGKARPLGEWAELLGISYGTLRSRLRLGWKPEKALTAPVRGKSRETVKANTA